MNDWLTTKLEQAGVSRSVAMKLTGHKIESVYRRYAIVSKSDLEEAVRRLDIKNKLDSDKKLAPYPIKRKDYG